jgi:hypothetical protein
MVRRHLTRDGEALLLPVANRAQGAFRAHMGDVDVTASHSGQRHVTCDDDLLRGARDTAQAEGRRVESFMRHSIALERRIFAVVDDRHFQHARVLERAPHDHRRPDRVPIVTDRDASGGVQLREIRELLPL